MSASITNSKGFTVQVDFDQQVGTNRKGIVKSNTLTTISGKGSWFGFGNVSDGELRSFANDILAELSPAPATPAKGKRAAKAEAVEPTVESVVEPTV